MIATIKQHRGMVERKPQCVVTSWDVWLPCALTSPGSPGAEDRGPSQRLLLPVGCQYVGLLQPSAASVTEKQQREGVEGYPDESSRFAGSRGPGPGWDGGDCTGSDPAPVGSAYGRARAHLQETLRSPPPPRPPLPHPALT
ncbi:hypothetical protein SKAU_G00141250 [Synaphobranchus kaupii]|uniref:Uncharacterized protein n=1 Tax=Synaphobranchus kaupii TaxID=118154 RepID=A0A9Q1FSR4_SYNKA|nr:hypothetical protein SKAU_G00141250 [Synaphobranchus kaupii]